MQQVNESSRDTEVKSQENDDTTVEINELQAAVDALNENIDELKAEVSDASRQRKAVGVDREKVNMEFQVTLADQRAMQKPLGVALVSLKGLYVKAALVQAQAHGQQLAGQAPLPGSSLVGSTSCREAASWAVAGHHR